MDRPRFQLFMAFRPNHVRIIALDSNLAVSPRFSDKVNYQNGQDKGVDDTYPGLDIADFLIPALSIGTKD